MGTQSGGVHAPLGFDAFSKAAVRVGPDSDVFAASDRTLGQWSGNDVFPVQGVAASLSQPGRFDASLSVADPRAGLWVAGHRCENLCYWPGGPGAGAFDPASESIVPFPKAPDGLLILVVMPDTDGSLWVGGKEGLARIRPRLVSPVRDDGGSVYLTVGPLGNGQMLIGTDDGDVPDYLWRHAPDGTPLANLGLHPATAMSADPDGSLLVGGPGTLMRYRAGTLTKEPFPSSFGNELVHQLLVTGPGAYWASVRHRGLFRVDHGTWTPGGNIPGLPTEWPLALAAGGKGAALRSYKSSPTLWCMSHGSRWSQATTSPFRHSSYLPEKCYRLQSSPQELTLRDVGANPSLISPRSLVRVSA